MSDNLIDIIVGRDTDNDMVVDWDLNGTPITIGDLRRHDEYRRQQEKENE